MLAFLLMKKIASLFLIVAMGALLVKRKILKSEDSRILSKLAVYVINPCVILTAFQMDCTKEVRDGLLVALFAGFIIHGTWIVITRILQRPLKLQPVEQISLVYSNAGNLIIPLVISLFGKEWVIYTSAFITAQTIFLWSHGVSVISGEKRFAVKKILCNMNMIATMVGMVVFFTGLRLPSLIQDSADSLTAMIGAMAMLITGMIIGGTDMKAVLASARIWLVVGLRLIGFPLVALAILKGTGIASLVPGGEQVLLITFLAAMTPTASMVTQITQIYGNDEAYAGAVNVLTTLCCILTMPVMVLLYQML